MSSVPDATPMIRRMAAPARTPQPDQRLRPPVRPLDDGSTELVTVLEFIWTANDGEAVQPVLWLDRELLH
jgi:hypothetical protein